MPSYQCKIGTTDGRVVDKVFEAAAKQQLLENLESQGFYVFQIRRRPLSWLSIKGRSSVRVSSARFLAFNQELLVLVRSGLPILQIFDAQLEQMENGSFRDIMAEIRQEVRAGSSLSDAFGKFPRMFSPLYLAALRAGEKTGDLPQTLGRFLAYQKRVEAIRMKVRNASFYPLLLTVAAILVVIFLMLYVVPRFTQIYADAGVDLPLITRLLMGFSSLLGRYWYLVLTLSGGLLLLFNIYGRGAGGRLSIDRAVLRVPFFGPLRVEYGLTGFTRTLGTTLSSGTPLVEALKMSRGSLNNLRLEQDMTAATRRVEEGESLSAALAQTGFFPPLALRMISVGETSGSLTDMLNEIADHYEMAVDQRLSRLTTMIEPVLMMTMGLIIAFIIVAMYVPIFQLAGTIG